MKDLDFDELDRAVNSLMTDASKKQPDASKAGVPGQEKTLDIKPTLGDDATPSFDKLNEATAKTAGVVESPVVSSLQKDEETTKSTSESSPLLPSTSTSSSGGTLPAARRGGRFMDMIHPSVNMKKPDAPARVSRQGMAVVPTRVAKKSEPTPEDSQQFTPPSELIPKPSEPDQEKPTPLAVPSQPPVETHTPAKSDWPDPLEMAGFKDEKNDSEPAEDNSVVMLPNADSSAEVVQDKAASTDSDETATSDQKSQEEKEQTSLTSPFLSDAKVEKRPLGGNVASTEVEEPSRVPVLGTVSEEKKSINNPDAQLPASPEDVEPELPEELQGDLVAIEADTTTHSHDTPVESEVPVISSEKEMSTSKVGSTPKALSSGYDQDEKLLPAGPTSIPQQYREEESTGDKDNGAIYDTSSYHQPLAHPAKKKSGWLMVLWIAIILLLGAGGGAALYLSGIV